MGSKCDVGQRDGGRLLDCGNLIQAINRCDFCQHRGHLFACRIQHFGRICLGIPKAIRQHQGRFPIVARAIRVELQPTVHAVGSPACKTRGEGVDVAKAGDFDAVVATTVIADAEVSDRGDTRVQGTVDGNQIIASTGGDDIGIRGCA